MTAAAPYHVPFVETPPLPKSCFSSVPPTVVHTLESTGSYLRSLIPADRKVDSAFSIEPSSDLEHSYRHGNDDKTRPLIFLAMLDSPSVSNNRLDRFCSCGSSAWVEYSPATAKARVSSNKCKDRWCPACGREKTVRIMESVRKRVPFSGGRLRFITLTLRNNGELSLDEAILRMRECFSSLRHRAEWKQHVVGGVAVLEAKLGQLAQWHVHFHCILEGDYWPHKDLSALWLKVTGNSSVVHLKSIDSQKELERKVSYVCKYAVKPVSEEVILQPVRLAQALVAFKGLRQYNWLGSWYGMTKDEEEKPDTICDDWCTIAPLSRVVDQAAQGVPWAVDILNSLKEHKPLENLPPYRRKPPPVHVPLIAAVIVQPTAAFLPF